MKKSKPRALRGNKFVEERLRAKGRGSSHVQRWGARISERADAIGSGKEGRPAAISIIGTKAEIEIAQEDKRAGNDSARLSYQRPTPERPVAHSRYLRTL